MSRDTLKMQHDAKKNEEPEPTVDGWPLHSGLPKPVSEPMPTKELFQRCLESLIFKYTVAEKHELIDLLLVKLTALDKSPEKTCKRCQTEAF